MKITKRWWEEELSNFDILTSEEIFDELNEGNYPNKIKVIEFTSKLPLLTPD